jgi:hypothetical protein
MDPPPSSVGMPVPLLWLYAAIFGNYDFYLLEEKEKHLW